VILCQITSQAPSEICSVTLDSADFIAIEVRAAKVCRSYPRSSALIRVLILIFVRNRFWEWDCLVNKRNLALFVVITREKLLSYRRRRFGYLTRLQQLL
jgi:hypothetical protein